MKQIWHFWLLLIIAVLPLAACSDETEAGLAEEAPEEAAAADEPAGGNQIPKAARTVEEMIAQPAGVLVGTHMDPAVEAARSVNWVSYHRFYEDDFRDIARQEAERYMAGHEGMSADDIYDYLVYQLGSGQYKPLYQELASYEHGYVMPELPDGKDEIEQAKETRTNVVVLMDASGSMKAEIDGTPKMQLAKEAVETFTSGLDDEVHVALFAYGHKGAGTNTDKALSCAAIEELYPLSAYDSESFHQAMESFGASGWTPLAGAMDQAGDYLAPYKEGYRNIVYVVSDGIETCDQDPIQAAKRLGTGNIEAKLNIIGFDVDDEGQRELKKIAEAGGGTYTTVQNKEQIDGVFIKKWQPSMMQVLSQQGVKLHELVHQKEDLIAIYDPLSNLSTRETARISDAAYHLRNEKLISDEVADEVIELAKRMGELRDTAFRELKDQKSEEAEQAMKEIDEAVEAWKSKWMDELKK